MTGARDVKGVPRPGVRKKSRVPAVPVGVPQCGSCETKFPWSMDAAEADFGYALPAKLPLTVDLGVRSLSDDCSQFWSGSESYVGRLKIVVVKVEEKKKGFCVPCGRQRRMPPRRKVFGTAALGIFLASSFYVAVVLLRLLSTRGDPTELLTGFDFWWRQFQDSQYKSAPMATDALVGVVAALIPATFAAAEKLKSARVTDDTLLAPGAPRTSPEAKRATVTLLEVSMWLLLVAFGTAALYALTSAFATEVPIWNVMAAGITATGLLTVFFFLDPMIPLWGVTERDLEVFAARFKNRRRMVEAIPQSEACRAESKGSRRPSRLEYWGLPVLTLLVTAAVSAAALLCGGLPLRESATFGFFFSLIYVCALFFSLRAGGTGERLQFRFFGGTLIFSACLLYASVVLSLWSRQGEQGFSDQRELVGATFALVLVVVSCWVGIEAFRAASGKGSLRAVAAVSALHYARQARSAYSVRGSVREGSGRGDVLASEREFIAELCAGHVEIPDHCGILVAVAGEGSMLPKAVRIEYWDELAWLPAERIVTWHPEASPKQVIPLLFMVGTEVELVLESDNLRWVNSSLTRSDNTKRVVVQPDCDSQKIRLEVETLRRKKGARSAVGDSAGDSGLPTRRAQ